jgi:hypothetical protein
MEEKKSLGLKKNTITCSNKLTTGKNSTTGIRFRRGCSWSNVDR